MKESPLRSGQPEITSLGECVWKEIETEKPVALLGIGSRNSVWYNENSDFDFLAIVEGRRALGSTIPVTHIANRVECLFVGLDSLNNFFSCPPSEFLDIAWLSGLSLIASGRILIDPDEQIPRLREKFSRYVRSNDWQKYLSSLLYKGLRLVEKSEHFEKEEARVEAALIRSYAAWHLTFFYLAKHGDFFHGSNQIRYELKEKHPELYHLLVGSCLNATNIESAESLKDLLRLCAKIV